MARDASGPNPTAPADAGRHYELCFHCVSAHDPAYCFPCDHAGRVDIDALSDAERIDYLYARALIGRRFQAPAVRADVPDPDPVTPETAHH